MKAELSWILIEFQSLFVRFVIKLLSSRGFGWSGDRCCVKLTSARVTLEAQVKFLLNFMRQGAWLFLEHKAKPIYRRTDANLGERRLRRPLNFEVSASSWINENSTFALYILNSKIILLDWEDLKCLRAWNVCRFGRMSERDHNRFFRFL